MTHSIRLCNLSPFTYSGRAPTGKSTLLKNRPSSVIDFFLIVTEWLSTEVKDNYFTDLMIGSPSIPLHRRLFATGLLCSPARLAGTAYVRVKCGSKLETLSTFSLWITHGRQWTLSGRIGSNFHENQSHVQWRNNVVGRGDKIQRPPSGGAPSSWQNFF